MCIGTFAAVSGTDQSNKILRFGPGMGFGNACLSHSLSCTFHTPLLAVSGFPGPVSMPETVQVCLLGPHVVMHQQYKLVNICKRAYAGLSIIS